MKEHQTILKCQICEKEFSHLGSHIWHGHHITARDYKEEFGLPYKMALISQDIYEKKRKHFEENQEKYLKNLLKCGKKNRFKKGHSGLHRTSEHERKTIIKRIQEVNERKKTLTQCPVCKMKFNHIESHLYNSHKLLKVK